MNWALGVPEAGCCASRPTSHASWLGAYILFISLFFSPEKKEREKEPRRKPPSSFLGYMLLNNSNKRCCNHCQITVTGFHILIVCPLNQVYQPQFSNSKPCGSYLTHLLDQAKQSDRCSFSILFSQI